MTRGRPDPDVVFDLLANQRRRRVLAVLSAEDRRLTVNDLTTAIALEESGPAITDVPGEAIEDIFLSLQHVHVPKLAALELIEYDGERRLVEPTDRLAALEPSLSAVLDGDLESAAWPDPAESQ